MSRQEEDALLAHRRALRMEAKRMLQRIVEARLIGSRDDEAIVRLGELTREKVEMTAPDFTLAA